METTSKKDPIIYISSKDLNKKLEQINYNDLKSDKHSSNMGLSFLPPDFFSS